MRLHHPEIQVELVRELECCQEQLKHRSGRHVLGRWPASLCADKKYGSEFVGNRPAPSAAALGNCAIKESKFAGGHDVPRAPEIKHFQCKPGVFQ
ncbi:hypothetical protein [Bradyrhizobium sp. RDM4]|uniref:hypothetical protein n=1 Tax=Bradyrhizobium sp. RDM4 TaxID=3378765 RepID=UPI0038FD3D2D